MMHAQRAKKQGPRPLRKLKIFLSEDLPKLGSVVSVTMIVGTLLFLVFLQMEERRLGYGVLKLSRIYKEKLDEKHYQEIHLARSLRLEKMEALASRKLTLHRVVGDQVIHLNDTLRPIEKPKKAATTRWLSGGENDGAVR